MFKIIKGWKSLSFIGVILALSFFLQDCRDSSYSNINSRKIEYQDVEKRWEWLLKTFPAEQNASRLKYKSSFPNINQENRGILLLSPLHICSDNENNIYVSDTKQSSILKFDFNGNFMKSIGEEGQAPGEFSHPTYITFDVNNNLIIYDTGNSRIQIFNPQKKFLIRFKIFKSYSTMAINKLGNYYFSPISPELKDPLIEVLDSNGQLIQSFGKRNKFKYYSAAHNEIDISINSKGEIFAAWKNFPYVKRFSKEGELLSSYKINHKLIQKLAKPNYKAKKIGNKIRMSSVIDKIIAKENKFYLFYDYPRIEILELSLRGEIIKQYWKECDFGFVASDFLIEETTSGKLFYVLERYPEQKVNIFSAVD